MKSKAFIWTECGTSLKYGDDLDKSRLSRIGDDIYFSYFGGVGAGDNAADDCILGAIGFSYYKNPYKARYVSEIGVSLFHLFTPSKGTSVGTIK